MREEGQALTLKERLLRGAESLGLKGTKPSLCSYSPQQESPAGFEINFYLDVIKCIIKLMDS